MAVIGIKNLDAITKRIELMDKACQPEVLDKAMEAAGDILADALAAGTPVSKYAHKTGKRKGEYRMPGNARSSIINIPARSKTYGRTRRLIGYSDDAYYMLWVIKGHKMVTRGRLTRHEHRNDLGGKTHGQRGRGEFNGMVPPHDFMTPIFKSNIKRAMEAAKEVIRKAAQTGSVPGKGK